MGSANVSELSGLTNVSVPLAKQSVAQKDEKDKDFLAMMATSMPQTNVSAGSVSDTPVFDVTDKASVGDSDKKNYPDFSMSKNQNERLEKRNDLQDKPALTDEEVEKVKEAVSSYEEKMTNVIEEDLNVSEEQIVHAMEELGLTFMDLSDPANLAKLIGQLEGGDNTVDLLTNASVNDLMQNVESLTDDLTEMTGLNLTELTEVTEVAEVLEFSEASKVSEGQTSVVPDVNTTTQTGEKIDISMLEPVDEDADMALLRQAAENAKELTVTTDEKGDEDAAPMQRAVGQAQEGASHSDNATNHQNNSNHQTPTQTAPTTQPTDSSAATVTQNTTFAQTQAEVITEAPQVDSYVSVDTQNVIEQIVTAARTQITAQVRSMELELNPQNLGRMLMQVAERDGQITARIFTQNESVKAALEMQMTLLKEQLNEQGIKVEAVEVAVATHEFEQNLEEGQENLLQEEMEQKQEEQNKNTRRGIHLGDPDALLEEDLSEEEILTARIMKDEGNMVNFRA